MIEFAKKLWPINRSLTGAGVNLTLLLIKQKLPIKILNFNSGEKVFDWKIPKVWNLKEAWIKNKNNKKIIDFRSNNLHVVGYSQNINKTLTFNELKKKIYTLKDQPNAIPYVTSYYKKDWGFCLQYNKFKKLKNDEYRVYINSSFKKGKLKIGELYIKGFTKKEILISTYICHPSMANNEISGIVVTTKLAQWLKKKKRKFSYRFLFLPETIGSIAYLSKNFKKLQKNVVAGYVLTCIGDNRNYSILESKQKNSLSDIAAKHILKKKKRAKIYDWSMRGSDERQYCSPRIDLPIASLMRSKYGEYKEYHTSLDQIGKVVTKRGLEGGYNFAKQVINCLEQQIFPKSVTFCEPFLTKKKIYPTISKKGSVNKTLSKKLEYLSYCDGKKSAMEISIKLNLSEKNSKEILRFLKKNNLVKINKYPN
tara:strand:- start:3590 stop:4858 length:1269 start_codon:yes stop_codon:yes gene_type:complete